MSQTVYLNQFSQTPIKGNSATKVNLNTLPVTIDPNSAAVNSATAILPGDAVYLTTTTANQIYVDKWSSGKGQPIGFVLYNMRIDQFKANDRVEIGLSGTIMFAEAGATISRGQSLEYSPQAVATGPQMIPAAGINPVSAIALDNAASGGIFRMMVLWQPEAYQSQVYALTYVAGGITINPENGETQTYSATTSATFNASYVIPNSQLYFIITSATTAASTAITFGTNFKYSSATLAVSPTIGKVTTITFIGDGVNYNEIARVSTGM